MFIVTVVPTGTFMCFSDFLGVVLCEQEARCVLTCYLGRMEQAGQPGRKHVLRIRSGTWSVPILCSGSPLPSVHPVECAYSLCVHYLHQPPIGTSLQQQWKQGGRSAPAAVAGIYLMILGFVLSPCLLGAPGGLKCSCAYELSK